MLKHQFPAIQPSQNCLQTSRFRCMSWYRAPLLGWSHLRLNTSYQRNGPNTDMFKTLKHRWKRKLIFPTKMDRCCKVLRVHVFFGKRHVIPNTQSHHLSLFVLGWKLEKLVAREFRNQDFNLPDIYLKGIRRTHVHPSSGKCSHRIWALEAKGLKLLSFISKSSGKNHETQHPSSSGNPAAGLCQDSKPLQQCSSLCRASQQLALSSLKSSSCMANIQKKAVGFSWLDFSKAIGTLA